LFLAGCGERPLEPRDPTPGVPHFKIKTYNVLTDKHDDPRTVTAVGADSADIVCLQETTAEWEAALRGRYSRQYPHMLFRAAPGAAGLAVLSRYPLEEGEFIPGPNDWHPAWYVLAETPAGSVQILNLHLRSKLSGNGDSLSSYGKADGDHLFEVQIFTQQASQHHPTIVLGDFNEGVDGVAIRFFEDRGYRNVLPLFHPGQPTWRYRSVANQFTQTLDHILFDAAFAPLNAWVINQGSSDHLPVVAHFEAAYAW
jgi:endonuclease/exonuclease/phosphatase family metal-dependent hydrolase